ncbi:MAG: hypothetical protein NTW36_14260 [Planctomycetia bacterium]|jgi:hypothetical protein|nr:hypothetical protein [Planctomycetia bacterium]
MRCVMGERIVASWCLAGLAGLVAIAAGCGGTDGRVAVQGRVLVDGQPTEGVRLDFLPSPDGKGNGGFSVSQADGQFAATTHQFRRGIFPGEYTITASWRQLPTTPEPGPDTPMDERVAWTNAQMNAPERLQSRYQNPGATPLRATVDGKQDPLTIEVQSAAGPKKP